MRQRERAGDIRAPNEVRTRSIHYLQPIYLPDMHESDNFHGTEKGISRRSFLEKLFTATIASAVVPSVLLGQATPRIAAEGNSVSGFYTLDLNDAPMLQQVGGSVRLTISEISPTFRVIITRVSETQFESVNATCPHEGNLIKAREGTNDYLECSAHESQFKFDGTFISGPADGKNLTRYSTTFDGASTVQVEIDALSGVDEAGSGSRTTYVKIHSTGPMESQVVFEYALPASTHVTLGIWSLDGREALRPLQGYREGGVHHLPCDISSLAAGMYLFRLITPEGVIGSGKLPVR